MDIIEKISVFSSKLTIQYIHSDSPALDINRMLDLKRLFSKVYVSSHLENGWQDYHKIFVETKKYPDIIITDIALQKKNMNIFQKIFQENKNQVIIAISDFSEKEFLANYIDVGIAYMMLKPLELAQFNNVIYRASEFVFHRKWDQKRLQQRDREVELLKKELKEMRSDLNYSMEIIEDLMNKALIENNKANTASCDSIENISLIDHDDGITRMGGDEELYKELLEGFCQYYKDTAVKMKQALEEMNFDELASLAHGVKGASGNISAKYLFDIAKELETTAREEGSKFRLFFLIVKFKKAFNELCSCVDKIIKN